MPVYIICHCSAAQIIVVWPCISSSNILNQYKTSCHEHDARWSLLSQVPGGKDQMSKYASNCCPCCVWLMTATDLTTQYLPNDAWVSWTWTEADLLFSYCYGRSGMLKLYLWQSSPFNFTLSSPFNFTLYCKNNFWCVFLYVCLSRCSDWEWFWMIGERMALFCDFLTTFLPLDEAIASRTVVVIVSGSDGPMETPIEPAK